MGKLLKIVYGLIITVVLITVSYYVVLMADGGFLAKWRDIYIETAMTTGEHQWLATKVFPKYLIDEVMCRQVFATQVDDSQEISMSDEFMREYNNLSVGDRDPAGNEIYELNIKNKLAISEIKGKDYRGKAVIVFDPSLVGIVCTESKGTVGENIENITNKNNAILGVNASGFSDPNGSGSGGSVIGLCRSNGKDWGNYIPDMDTIALSTDNKLLVGNRKDWNMYSIRDACQFNPVLIQNGKQNVKGTAGWGLQPRTAIGQREDGVIIIIVVDGRKPGYSLGATMEDLVNEFEKYNVVNAAACDGGSSSIIGYKGKVITKCSSPQSGGRYLPNAIIVKMVN